MSRLGFLALPERRCKRESSAHDSVRKFGRCGSMRSKSRPEPALEKRQGRSTRLLRIIISALHDGLSRCSLVLVRFGCRTLAFFKGAGFSKMRNPLERRYGQGDLHFITFSCFGRRPLLGTTAARDCFVRKLGEVRIRYSFRLIGYVVMPEHVHLLLSEPTTGDLSIVLQVLKQRVSRTLLARHAAGKLSAESHFWMRRFYDFNVWTGKKLTEKLHYMHLNPVNRNLVTHPKDWPWSSWLHYATGDVGLIGIDRWNESVGQNENPHP